MYHQCFGRPRGCSGSTAEQKPPSFYRSSELRQANENSTGIVYDKTGRCLGDVNNNKSRNEGTIALLHIHKEKLSISFTKILPRRYLRAWTRFRSVNSWRSTKAWRTLILKSSLWAGRRYNHFTLWPEEEEKRFWIYSGSVHLSPR